MRDKSREGALAEVLSASENYYLTVVEFATGFGKTNVSIEFFKKWFRRGRILVGVEETPQIENYLMEVKKHGAEAYEPHIDTTCYASLSKYRGRSYDVVVLDEGHNCMSDSRQETLREINAHKIVLLSATLSDEHKEVLRRNFQSVVFHKISLGDAIEGGVLSQPTIKYIDVYMDNTDKKHLVTYGKKQFYVTEVGYYEYLCKNIDYLKDELNNDPTNQFIKNKLLSEGGKRQRFMSEVKERKLREMVDKMREEKLRYICFCGSKPQAKKFGGKNTCSSDNTKEKNKELIERFNNKEIDELFAKDMLKEAVNLVDTRFAIVVQLGNQSRELCQMLGRVMRHPKPVMYILRIPNTVDDRFISNSLQGLFD